MDHENSASESEEVSPAIQELDADEQSGDCGDAGALAIRSKDDQLQCITASDSNQVAVAGFTNEFSERMVVDQRQSQVIIEGADFKGSNVGQRTVVEGQHNISNSNVTINQYYYGAVFGPEFNNKSILRRSASFKVTEETPITQVEPPQQSADTVDDELIPGEGWIPLSERLWLFNKEPIREGTKVYHGKQKHASDCWRKAAIKILPYNPRTCKEVEILLKLDSHPNVTRVYESGDRHGTIREMFIAMELCSQNLQQYTVENHEKPFNFMKTAIYGKQLIAGLAFIHKNKIVHGDLKPDNVLISMCKNYLRLSDFGLSKIIPENRSMASTSSSVVGVDGYRAPELYVRKPKVSTTSDIFSLGIVSHFLFTNGKHPFGTDPYDWRDNIRKNKNRDLSQIRCLSYPSSHKRSQLLHLIESLLNHNSECRPTAERAHTDDFFKDIPSTLGNKAENDIQLRNMASSPADGFEFESLSSTSAEVTTRRAGSRSMKQNATSLSESGDENEIQVRKRPQYVTTRVSTLSSSTDGEDSSENSPENYLEDSDFLVSSDDEDTPNNSLEGTDDEDPFANSPESADDEDSLNNSLQELNSEEEDGTDNEDPFKNNPESEVDEDSCNSLEELHHEEEDGTDDEDSPNNGLEALHSEEEDDSTVKVSSVDVRLRSLRSRRCGDEPDGVKTKRRRTSNQ